VNDILKKITVRRTRDPSLKFQLYIRTCKLSDQQWSVEEQFIFFRGNVRVVKDIVCEKLCVKICADSLFVAAVSKYF
jgi:hypothetical protein